MEAVDDLLIASDEAKQAVIVASVEVAAHPNKLGTPVFLLRYFPRLTTQHTCPPLSLSLS